jgi:hypothetical protein
MLAGNLTGQANTQPGIPSADMIKLGGKDFPATFQNPNLTLSASSPTSTGGGNKDLVGSQSIEQFTAGGHLNAAFIIDQYFDIPKGDKPGARQQNKHDQTQHDRGKHRDAQDNLQHAITLLLLQLDA